MLLGAVVATRQGEDQRIAALELAERTHRAGLVRESIIREDAARPDVRTHRITPLHRIETQAPHGARHLVTTTPFPACSGSSDSRSFACPGARMAVPDEQAITAAAAALRVWPQYGPASRPAATRWCAAATSSSGRVAATRGVAGGRRRARQALPAAARRCGSRRCARVPRNGMGAAPAATATNEPLSRTASSAATPTTAASSAPSTPAGTVTSSHWPGCSAGRFSACTAVRPLSGIVNASAAGTRRRRDRVAVEDHLLCLRAYRRGQQIAHSDHGVASIEPVRARTDGIDDAGQVPPDADVTAGIGPAQHLRIDRSRAHADGARDRDSRMESRLAARSACGAGTICPGSWPASGETVEVHVGFACLGDGESS